MTDLVFRTPRGRLSHWARPTNTHSLATICSGWPVTDTPLDPVSVDMGARCHAGACRVAWQEWLRRTIHAALVDELARCRPTSQQETPA